MRGSVYIEFPQSREFGQVKHVDGNGGVWVLWDRFSAEGNTDPSGPYLAGELKLAARPVEKP